MPRQKRTAKSLPSGAADSYSPFLNLPAELRNEVYKYYLSEAKGIKMIWVRGPDRWTKKPAAVHADSTSERPINQLQYVCRQLRKEAAGLEIMYNNVEFQSLPGRIGTEVESLYMFAEQCSPQKLNWLTHVSISPPSGLANLPAKRTAPRWLHAYTVETTELLEFGVTHPHMRIDLRIPYFTYVVLSREFSAARFMQKGILLQLLFRGVDMSAIHAPVFSAKFFNDSVRMLCDQDTRATILRLAREAQNVRFFPTNTDISANTFAAGTRAYLCRPGLQDWVAHGGGSDWVSWATRWASEGI